MPNTITKAELVDIVVTKVGGGLTKRMASEVIDAVLDGITDALCDGAKVQLTGFGSFEVRERKSRIGRNPANPGETIVIPAQKAPAFKAGKRLKDAVK
ncbi:MAG: HU family DNA-binding protein [Candidatus Zipacnadales bacterium]